MLNRRTLIFLLTALPGVLALPAWIARPARASPAADQASAFIKATGVKLVAAINAAGSVEDRRKVVGSILDTGVDVNGVARFCLGRFWRTATPAEQQQYLSLFRDVLVANIAIKLGEYRGVRFTVGATQDRDAGEVVSTIVDRPNNPPTNIQWLVANAASDPKIVDVIAEGTSLRITQRDDYAAFLSQHGNKLDALFGAMRQQLSQGG
jgi:phospholipid transport system substrate-binding protein